MLLTGHQLSAEELHRRGAIEACLKADELLPFSYRIAETIAGHDPRAIAMARATLSEVEDMGVLEGYRHEMQAAEELGRSREAQDAMRGFLDGKR